MRNKIFSIIYMSDSNELIQQQKNEKIEQLKKELADLGENEAEEPEPEIEKPTKRKVNYVKTEKRQEAFKRAVEAKMRNAEARKKEREAQAEQEKAELEAKLVKKAIALKKRQIKKQQLLDRLIKINVNPQIQKEIIVFLNRAKDSLVNQNEVIYEEEKPISRSSRIVLSHVIVVDVADKGQRCATAVVGLQYIEHFRL